MTATLRATAAPADSSPADGLGDRVVEEFRAMTSNLRRLLEGIGEIERRGAFRSGGYTSTASWVMANLSVAYPTARGYVDVGTALVDLPALAEALEAGEVSFDQVRTLCRVATATSDTDLARRARRWSAGQTEDYVRREETRRADEARRRREESLAKLRAEEATRAAPSRAGTPAPEAGGPLFATPPTPTRCSSRNPVATARPGTLRLQARRDGGSIEGWLPTEDFAAFESTLLALAKAAPPDALTKRQRPLPERMARALLDLVTASATPTTSTAGDRVVPTVVVHADVSLLDGSGDGDAVAEVPGAGPLGADVLRRLVCEAKLRLATDAGGLTIDLGRATRLPSIALAGEVLRRDNGCRFPGCSSRRFLQIHHVVGWAAGGSTDLDNLAAHCVLDHRRIHHEGWTVSGHANGELHYRGPSGESLISTPSPSWTASPAPRRSNRQRA